MTTEGIRRLLRDGRGEPARPDVVLRCTRCGFDVALYLINLPVPKPDAFVCGACLIELGSYEPLREVL